MHVEAVAPKAPSHSRSHWVPLVVLALGQFIMVLDSSVMNVSISNIVADLDTTVAGVQLAITAYTLVMAAFMLAGARLGDRWGTPRTFGIGLLVYGTGSLLTALSVSLPMLLFGWSLIEGLGAVLVIPAIAGLVVATYEGRDRALAYGVIGGVSGAAIAVGPLIGGWVTTNYSWRWVFAGETVCVLLMLLFGRGLRAAKTRRPPTQEFDLPGTITSALGLGIGVLAILKTSEWGWFRPLNPPELFGHTVQPLGCSPVPFLLAISWFVLAWFTRIERRRAADGRSVLLRLELLESRVLRSGLSTLMLQQLTLLGMFFLLPVYLQTVLGLDAFESGVRILPLSIALLAASLLGPRLAAQSSARTVVRSGLLALIGGSLATAGTVDLDVTGTSFACSLALFGAGAGLLLSQLGNVIMSSVPRDSSSDGGGLQGTAQNLGASLGTALIGSVLIAGLTSGVVTRIESAPDVPANIRTAVLDAADEGLDVVPVDAVEQAALDAGLSTEQASKLADGYAEEELAALRRALFVVAFLTLIGWWTSRDIPSRLDPLPDS